MRSFWLSAVVPVRNDKDWEEQIHKARGEFHWFTAGVPVRNENGRQLSSRRLLKLRQNLKLESLFANELWRIKLKYCYDFHVQL